MEQVDHTGRRPAQAARRDGGSRETLPPERVHGPAQHVAVPGLENLRLHVVAAVTVGKPEPGPDGVTGQPRQHLVRVGDLGDALIGRQRCAVGGHAGERTVIVGVVDDAVALRHDAPHQRGVLLGPAAGDPKRGGDPGSLQGVEDLPRIARVGRRVERQEHAAPGGRPPGHHDGTSRHLPGQGRRAGSRPGGPCPRRRSRRRRRGRGDGGWWVG